MMQARDASGRKVSLLNDEPTYQQYHDSISQRLSYSTTRPVISQVYHPALVRSATSSPNTPELLRSNSYDSQISNEPLSPLTPSMMYADYSQAAVYAPELRSPYEDYMTSGDPMSGVKGPDNLGDSRSTPYEDEDTTSSGSGSGGASAERTGKRYPCRYRDSHGCEKTFTTSGHASRHSKIHTAEKAVQCTFPGCAKKFTRADNMKQHLETHYKDRSRSGSRPTTLSSCRRHSSSSKSSSASKASASSSRSTPPLPSPSLAGTAWDLRGLSNLPLLTRPGAPRTQSSGLDALAMAAAVQVQEGA